MNRQIISKFTKTSILGLLLIVGIVSSVLAASEKLDGGKATWTGGEDTRNYVIIKRILFDIK